MFSFCSSKDVNPLFQTISDRIAFWKIIHAAIFFATVNDTV
jgi:hypothetical protein